MKKILFIILFLAIIIVFDTIPNQPYLKAAAGQADDFILSWSSDSYVPPGYQGKALPTHGSLVRVVVAPTKQTSPNAEKLFFSWFLDDKIVKKANGFGKTTFEFRVVGFSGETNEIRLEISGSNQKVSSYHYLAIKIVEPEVLLFNSNSGRVVKNTVSSKSDNELGFTAMPLFFDIKGLPELSFDWNFNNQDIKMDADQKNPERFTLKIPPANLAQALIRQFSVSTTDKNDLSQKATANIQIQIE